MYRPEPPKKVTCSFLRVEQLLQLELRGDVGECFEPAADVVLERVELNARAQRQQPALGLVGVEQQAVARLDAVHVGQLVLVRRRPLQALRRLEQLAQVEAPLETVGRVTTAQKL